MMLIEQWVDMQYLADHLDRDRLSKLKKKVDQQILKILQMRYVVVLDSKQKYLLRSLWNEDFDGKYDYTQSVVFDFIGPNGPADLKNRTSNPVGSGISNAKYLFVPVEVSKEKFFWKEHYDFLQYVKKLILDNPHNLTKSKDKKEIFRHYINERFNEEHSYLENVFKIDSKKIPEIMNTWEKTQKIMESSS